MGVTKQYLRVEPTATFGLVASHRSSIVLLDRHDNSGRCAAVGTCEHVIVWDLHTKEKIFTLTGDKHEVTVLARSPDHTHLSVGYMDGSVRVFELRAGECTVAFHGHRSAVTALAYDHDGLRIVSGAKDTDVIVWDVVSEAGLFRLKGHKGEITKVLFFKGKNILITSSKDTFIKFWDLDTQHCFRTLTGHRAEVYSFVLVNGGRRLITGSSDSELRVWDIIHQSEADDETDDKGLPSKQPRLADDTDSEEEDEGSKILRCDPRGSVMRQGRDRVVCLVTDQSDRHLLCHGPGSYCEVFVLAREDELKKKLAKRRKKSRLRGEASGEGETSQPSLTIEDEVRRIDRFKLSAKLRWLDAALTAPGQLKIAVLLNNNSMEMATVSVDIRTLEVQRSSTIHTGGHRSDVRTLTFSSDSATILSASAEEVKLWARSSLQCIRTMTCDYALCSAFAPGDRHIIIGTKSGKVQVFDVDEGSLVAEIEAHSGALWSLCSSPDKRGIITGGADHTVKFWNFELVTPSNGSSRKQLTLVHKRTLQMDEDVLCVKYSPDQRLLAVALLDNTVKVFFVDTLKFFLSLYGHKLPVLCMDISSDSTLIVTGSADRNIKIWGLDFGDCHRSLFAHDDSIMCLQFVPKTHLFYTGGKDRKVKQWDADNFENITTLQGHHGEVWALAVSPSGNFVVSASHDRSIRLWEKTQEVLVLEEEREMEREKEYDESVAQGDEPVVAGETTTEVSLAGKKTIETVKAAERLMEAVEIYTEETQKLAEYAAQCKTTGKELPPPTPHPLMMAHKTTSPARFVLEIIRKIKSSELEEALLVLPFSTATELLSILEVLLNNGWDTELTCRCLLFLLKIHQGQVTSTQVLLPVIDRLRAQTTRRTDQLKDLVGFNLMGMQMLRLRMEERQEVKLFADATSKFREKKKKRKAILTITS